MPPIRRQVQDVARRDHSLKNLKIVEHVEVHVCTRAPRERMAVRKSTKLLDVSRLDEHHFLEQTLTAAHSYASSNLDLNRFEEAKALLRKTLPIARRVLGDNDQHTLTMRWQYAVALYSPAAATLDDLREAVARLEDTERIARRVLGGAHPVTMGIERALRNSRAALRTRETPLPSPWEAHNDAGTPYYHNRRTGVSVWTLPDELFARETPSP